MAHRWGAYNATTGDFMMFDEGDVIVLVDIPPGEDPGPWLAANDIGDAPAMTDVITWALGG